MIRVIARNAMENQAPDALNMIGRGGGYLDMKKRRWRKNIMTAAIARGRIGPQRDLQPLMPSAALGQIVQGPSRVSHSEIAIIERYMQTMANVHMNAGWLDAPRLLRAGRRQQNSSSTTSSGTVLTIASRLVAPVGYQMVLVRKKN